MAMDKGSRSSYRCCLRRLLCNIYILHTAALPPKTADIRDFSAVLTCYTRRDKSRRRHVNALEIFHNNTSVIEDKILEASTSTLLLFNKKCHLMCRYDKKRFHDFFLYFFSNEKHQHYTEYIKASPFIIWNSNIISIWRCLVLRHTNSF